MVNWERVLERGDDDRVLEGIGSARRVSNTRGGVTNDIMT